MLKDLLDCHREDVIAAGGEFVGTILFLVLGLGGIQASATSNSASLAAATTSADGAAAINTVASIDQLVFIAASMGISLLFSAWIFYRATGAAFNPNVSFALFLIGVINPVRFVLYCVAQFVGAIVASAILDGLLPGPLVVTPSLGAGTNKAQGVFIEMFGTCALVLSVLFLAVEKHRATYLAPVGIGLALFAIELFGVVYTGAAVNTARAFGPAAVTGGNGDLWIYLVGPTLGALLAVAIYIALKWSRYWRLNPGQDSDEPVDSPSLGRIGSRDEPSLASSPRHKSSSLGLEPSPNEGGIHSRLDAEKGLAQPAPGAGTGHAGESVGRTSNVNGTTPTGRMSADNNV